MRLKIRTVDPGLGATLTIAGWHRSLGDGSSFIFTWDVAERGWPPDPTKVDWHRHGGDDGQRADHGN